MAVATHQPGTKKFGEPSELANLAGEPESCCFARGVEEQGTEGPFSQASSLLAFRPKVAAIWIWHCAQPPSSKKPE